jgi:hypothetical protein
MQSDNIADLAKALVKAQARLEGARKDSRNPHLNSKYADLASVWDACREAITGNGLSVVQTLDDNCGDNQVCVVTTLLHESGQWIRSRLRMVASRPSKQGEQIDPQSVGSAITYARRYALAAIVGVCPEDDDAEAAMQRGGRSQTRGESERPQTSTRPKAGENQPGQATNTMTVINNPGVAAAKAVCLQIKKVMKEYGLAPGDVQKIGEIASLQAAVDNGDIESLQRALRLLEEKVVIPRREAMEATQA